MAMNDRNDASKREAKAIPDDIKQQMVELGRRIDELRIVSGNSKQLFTSAHGINRMTLHRILSGEDTNLSTLLIIIKALGSTPEDFFTGIR